MKRNHDGVVTAVPVGRLGEGVNVQHAVVEVGVEGQEGVLHFLVELGNGRGDGEEDFLEDKVLVETGQGEVTGQGAGVGVGEDRRLFQGALGGGRDVREGLTVFRLQVEQEREVRANDADGGDNVGHGLLGQRAVNHVLLHSSVRVVPGLRLKTIPRDCRVRVIPAKRGAVWLLGIPC